MGLTCGPQPPLAFPEEWRKGLETGLDGDGVNHPATLGTGSQTDFHPKSRFVCFSSDPIDVAPKFYPVVSSLRRLDWVWLAG